MISSYDSKAVIQRQFLAPTTCNKMKMYSFLTLRSRHYDAEPMLISWHTLSKQTQALGHAPLR